MLVSFALKKNPLFSSHLPSAIVLKTLLFTAELLEFSVVTVFILFHPFSPQSTPIRLMLSLIDPSVVCLTLVLPYVTVGEGKTSWSIVKRAWSESWLLLLTSGEFE